MSMWKQVLFLTRHQWRSSSTRVMFSTTAATTTTTTTASSSAAIDSLILRSLKDHYLELSKMNPPPKISPPAPYTIIKGALDGEGPVLRADYKGDEIKISVMRLSTIMPSGAGEDEDEDGEEEISQLFLHVDVSRPERKEGINFLCGLYPDAVGIHSVCLTPKDPAAAETSDADNSSKYRGRLFQELDQKIRDAFHMYIEDRGVNEKLFPFLRAWLYVKEHRNLLHWFKGVGTFIKEHKQS